MALLTYIFFFLSINAISFSKIINETSITSDVHENIINFYCDKLKDKGINLDIYYALSLSNKNWHNDLIDKLNSYSMNKEEQILGIFLVDKGIIQFRVKSNIINASKLDDLTEQYFQYQIDNMEYLIENGEIISKVALNDKKYIFDQMILASLNLLIGICDYTNIDLNISDNILKMLKDPNTFNKKIDAFLDRKEDDKLNEEVEENNIEEDIEKDISLFNINSSINVAGHYIQSKGYNRIDPITNLNEYNIDRKELDCIMSINPRFKYGNVLLNASIAIPYYINDISNKNNENILNSRMDYIKSTIKYNSGEFKLLLGNVDFKHSNNILNYNLRGYQIYSLFEFKDKKLFLDYIFIPEGKFLGYENRYKKQEEIRAISFGIKNNKYNFKYIFGESSKSNISVQEFLFNTKIEYENIKNVFHIFYSLSNDENKGVGNRWNLRYLLNFSINKENSLKSSYFIQNFSSTYSANTFADNYYKTNVAKYIDRKNSEDQYGFGCKVLTSLLNKRLLSELIYEYYKKRDLNLNTYLFSFNNKVILNNCSIVNKTYLEKDSFEIKGLFSLKSKYNTNIYNYSGYLIPEYEYKRYVSKDIYSKYTFQILEKGNYKNISKKYNYNISSNSNLSYSINPDKLFVLSLNNELLLKEGRLMSCFANFLSLNREGIGNKSTLHYSILKNNVSDRLFFNMFDFKKLKWNFKAKGLIYNSNIEYKDIKKGSIHLYLPFEIFDINNQISINMIKSVFNDKVTLINEVEIMSLKTFNRMDVRTNIKYNIYSIDEYDIDFKEFDSFEKDKTVNDKSNIMINNFNRDSMELDSEISNKISKINMKGLVDFFLNNRKSFINLSLIGGLGVEKILKEDSNSIFIETGFNINVNISENIKAKNRFVFDFHSNYKKVFNNILGIYILNEYIKNATMFVIGNDINKFNITLLSKGSIFYLNKFNCEYSAEYINYFNNIDNNQLKIEFALNTNILDSKDDNMFINFSNLYIKTNIYKKEKGDPSYSLSIGGHNKMFYGYNELNINGVIAKNRLNNESGNISLEDKQKIKNNIFLLTKLKYISNILNSDKDFKIYNFSLGINVTKFVINNLTLSLNISKEMHQYSDEFQKENREIIEGGINVSYFV